MHPTMSFSSTAAEQQQCKAQASNATPSAPAKPPVEICLWDNLNDDLQERIHSTATKQFFQEAVLADLDSCMLMRNVFTPLSTPYIGQHAYGNASMTHQASVVVCKKQNQVLLRFTHDGASECVYLKYLLARDPFCHESIAEVVLDFCTGGQARIAKFVDTFSNRKHSYYYQSMLPVLCEAIFRLRSFFGLRGVVGDSIKGFTTCVQLHLDSKINSHHKFQGNILKHQVVPEACILAGKIEPEARCGAQQAAARVQQARHPSTHSRHDETFVVPFVGGGCRVGRRLLTNRSLSGRQLVKPRYDPLVLLASQAISVAR
jgi:hypothetical protein